MVIEEEVVVMMRDWCNDNNIMTLATASTFLNLCLTTLFLHRHALSMIRFSLMEVSTRLRRLASDFTL